MSMSISIDEGQKMHNVYKDHKYTEYAILLCSDTHKISDTYNAVPVEISYCQTIIVF